MSDKTNIIHRNLIPTESELQNATTVRKLAEKLNALVAKFDADDEERKKYGRDEGSYADLPVVAGVYQESTPTGRLRDEALVPVRGPAGCRMGVTKNQNAVVLWTTRA